MCSTADSNTPKCDGMEHRVHSRHTTHIEMLARTRLIADVETARAVQDMFGDCVDPP